MLKAWLRYFPHDPYRGSEMPALAMPCTREWGWGTSVEKINHIARVCNLEMASVPRIDLQISETGNLLFPSYGNQLCKMWFAFLVFIVSFSL